MKEGALRGPLPLCPFQEAPEEALPLAGLFDRAAEKEFVQGALRHVLRLPEVVARPMKGGTVVLYPGRPAGRIRAPGSPDARVRPLQLSDSGGDENGGGGRAVRVLLMRV
jgi:hypothetical protein